MSPASLLLAFFLAAGLAWLATLIVRKLALKFKILDLPDSPRKIHSQPLPLLGGWAIFIALALTASVLLVWGFIPDNKVSVSLIGGFFAGGLILMLGGWLDDKYDLSWFQSLFFPVAACLTVIWAGLEVTYISNPLGGLVYLQDWPYQLPAILLFFWLLAMIYTTKLLDGLDGLASSIGLVASLVIFGVSLFWDDRGSTTTYLSLALAGSLLGFLIWNWHPAKIFLGESGSTFIGFSLGVLAILTGGKFATALLVMGLPMLDVVWTILRRWGSRSKIFSLGDTGHLHFRLLRLGLSQPQVVIFMSLMALMFGSVSFFTTSQGKLVALVILTLVMLLLGTVAVLRQKKE